MRGILQQEKGLGPFDGRGEQSWPDALALDDPFRASLELASMQSMMGFYNPLPEEAITLPGDELYQVLEHFHSQLQGRQVVMAACEPGLNFILPGVTLQYVSWQPGLGRPMDVAERQAISGADWVFLSVDSLANNSFSLYSQLAMQANLVLMGPTTPWVEELAEFGVDYLAGLRVAETASSQPAYCIWDIGVREMAWIKTAIADTVARRERIKSEMEQWYASRRGRFPEQERLDQIDATLSSLDSQFKRMWDARRNVLPQ